MAINKVIYGTSTLIDLTADTVATDTLGKDTTAHDKSGAEIVGTLESGGSTGGGSETWVLNDIVEGTNQLFEEGVVVFNATFTSNGTTFTFLAMVGDDDMGYSLQYDESEDVLPVDVAVGNRYDFMEFPSGNYIYRKVTFFTPPTGDFLTWLEANAVKQASDTAVQESKSVSITENGTTTVSPDVPYDAIKSVEVVTNVASSEGGDNCYIKEYPASGGTLIIHGATPFTFTHNLGRIPRFINITSSTTDVTAYALNYITAITDATGVYLSYWDVSGSKNDWNEFEVYPNYMSFPSNGFVGKASYVQIGNANKSTIDIKVGESSRCFFKFS